MPQGTCHMTQKWKDESEHQWLQYLKEATYADFEKYSMQQVMTFGDYRPIFRFERKKLIKMVFTHNCHYTATHDILIN